MRDMVVKIRVDGHVDDLYALSLLFPEGAYPDLHVVTAIHGTKDGVLDRVKNTDHLETYVTGHGCLPIIGAGFLERGWIAREIIAPLNGYATLADSNFKPVVPVSASWQVKGGGGEAVFGSSIPNRPTRAITANRHVSLRELLFTFMSENPMAAYAASVLAGQPSWSEYYRLLEDIAGHHGTSPDKLPETGLAQRQALKALTMGANNRAFGRHGMSKRNAHLSQDELMNLLEAREFVEESSAHGWMPNAVAGCPAIVLTADHCASGSMIRVLASHNRHRPNASHSALGGRWKRPGDRREYLARIGFYAVNHPFDLGSNFSLILVVNLGCDELRLLRIEGRPFLSFGLAEEFQILGCRQDRFAHPFVAG